MRNDQRRNQDERDEGFEDALDDLFGDTPDEAAPAAEPIASTPRTELEPAQIQPQPPPAVNLPTSDPAPPAQPAPPAGDRRTGRSVRRIGCIAISAIVGGIILCVVILAIIGFIVGDQSTPTPVV